MALRLIRLATATAVLFALCTPGAQAEDAPRNTKPFTRFKILLSSEFFNDTLPFDVPFILWGDLPPGTEVGALEPTGVTLRIAELPGSAADCRAVGPGDYEPPLRSEARTWTATDYTDRDITPVPTDIATTTRKQFEFMVRKLDPKKIYCFLFQKEPGRRMSSQEITALAGRLVVAYRGFLAKTGQLLTTDQQGVENLRQALIRDLFAASPFEGLRAIERTVFDANAVATEVFEEFRGNNTSGAVSVLNPHNNAITQAREANRVRPEDVSEFAQWSAPTLLNPLVTAAPEPVRADVALLSGLTTEQRSRLLLGAPLDAPPDPLESVFEAVPGFAPPDDPDLSTFPCPASGAVGARCLRLDETLARLSRIAALPGAPPLVNATIGDIRREKTILLRFQEAVNQRDAAMFAHLTSLQASLPTSVLVMTTTLGSLETRRRWYLGMDTGLAIAPSIDEVFPYVGTNVYFRPINFEAPPASFLTRFSAMVGFTWTDNLTKAGEREALYGSDAMVLLGAGLRLTDFIRVGGGALVLKAVDPNPFVDDDTIRVTPYFSLSADIDLAGVMGRLFGGDAAPPVIGGGTTK
ncbi:MAG TPA: hypothetical protein VFS23_41885 [Vicinamibacterales bacterium]|nr:hypothetical protein [Vicinamibacterales bacterium]